MVATRSTGEIAHQRFDQLPGLLSPGDLVVVNVSATLPAAVPGRRERDGSAVRVHFSTRAPGLDAERWRVVELRTPDGARPIRGTVGERVLLRGGGRLELVAPYASGARLLLARLGAVVEDYLADHGEPIRYGYVRDPWPLAEYQNVYATTPGSSEMPSAGRPFTPELITALVAQGIAVAPITLHCGVSSPERHEPPFPEQFEVPAATAAAVRAAHERGGRVIAIGTTVVRALETGRPSGWTNLVVTPDRKLHCGRRPDHRLARARGLAPAAARGGRWRTAAGALVRRWARSRVPVARVRRQPPAAAVASRPEAGRG